MAKAAPKAASTDNDTGPLDIPRIVQGVVEVYLRGVTPLIFNRASEKVKRELLLPRGRLNAAARAANLKHDPIGEYRSSVYRIRDDDNATRLGIPSTAFKGAMRTAALRLPGVARTEVDQLIWVEGYTVSVFGVPQLKMDMVRMANRERTPDIRTRAVLPEWCCRIAIRHTLPLINAQSAANLLAGGGMVAGVGDFRQEKGKGNFGLFDLVDANDKAWHRIADTCGRAAQDAALQEPVCFDEESEELLDWFDKEINRRGRQSAVTDRRSKYNGEEGEGVPA
jgi:hypothetical protein